MISIKTFLREREVETTYSEALIAPAQETKEKYCKAATRRKFGPGFVCSIIKREWSGDLLSYERPCEYQITLF
jgi:hypothetical protein